MAFLRGLQSWASLCRNASTQAEWGEEKSINTLKKKKSQDFHATNHSNSMILTLQSLSSSLRFLPRGTDPSRCRVSSGPLVCQLAVAASNFGGTSMAFPGTLKNPSPCSHDSLYGSNRFFCSKYISISFLVNMILRGLQFQKKKKIVRKFKQSRRQSRNAHKHPFITNPFHKIWKAFDFGESATCLLGLAVQLPIANS